MIDEPRLIRALDAVAGHLARLGRPAATLLQPGLTAQEIAKIEATLPFPLSEEARAVYRWRNGTDVTQGFVLGDLWFFPGFYLLSLEDAARIYGERRNSPQWRKRWFPLFEDGGGDFFVVPCQRAPVDQTPLIRLMHGEPEEDVHFLSITTMIETLADCYAQQAFFLTEDGWLEINDPSYRRIARLHNPGVAAWQ